MNLHLFIKLVMDMRQAQKNYFIGRDYKWLNKAKNLERQVDIMIENYGQELLKRASAQLTFNFDE